MAATEKLSMPPYAAFKAFSKFIIGLRENGMPSHISRSVLPGSNSGKATMAATLKSLGLVDKDDIPTEKLKQLVESPDDYRENLRNILRDSYGFLTDGSLDLKSTTTEKVTEKFKGGGATGSTISKCMAFFLAACKEAQIEISPFVKAPSLPKSSSNGKSKAKRVADDESTDDDEFEESDEDLEGMMKITIPLHGMKDGLVFFPEEMNKKQWEYALKMATFILENYRAEFDESQGGPE